MDSQKSFAAFRYMSVSLLNYAEMRNERAEPNTPSAAEDDQEESEPLISAGNSSEDGLEAAEILETAGNGFVYKPDDSFHLENAIDPHNATDRSQSENSALNNISGSNGNNGIVKGLRMISHHAYKWVTTKVQMAISKARDYVTSAVKTVKQKGVIGTAKALAHWVQENPWKTAFVVVPAVAMASTAITLLAMGFGPGGIAAGSAAAAIQAGIGNVVAGSLFATCTSAMMGGYGASIIFGGTWFLALLTTAGAKKAWRWWNSRNERRLVRFQGSSSDTLSKSFGKAADTLILGFAMAAAFAVYKFKSWRKGVRSPFSRLD